MLLITRMRKINSGGAVLGLAKYVLMLVIKCVI